MRYHSYKGKSGGYMKGRSRYGKYYTVSGCVLYLLPILAIMTILILILISVL